MRESLVILFFTLLNQLNGQQMELIAGHVLFRHGDRTPVTTYPTDPMKEKDWPNGYGQLTSTGIEQHRRLGQFLRRRYGSILSSNYTVSEIVVRSSDYDRTLMSAQSNLIGLYPLYNASSDQVPVQPIPIHTVPVNEDFLLGVNTCPRYKELQNEVYQTDVFKKINIYYAAFFEKLQLWTNMSNITFTEAQHIAGAIFIEYIYNKAPAWADDDVRKNLTDIMDLSFYFRCLNDDMRRIRGGPVIQDIWSNMNSSYHRQMYSKVKIYSAHDTTISAALAFLRIKFQHQPPYASALFLDLYKQNSTYFVKVEYLNVTDSNNPYPYQLDGCPAIECPLDTFTSIYQSRFPGSVDVECGNKTPPTPRGGDGHNTRLIIVLSVVVFGLVAMILGIVVYVYQKKRQHGSIIFSVESYSTIA